MSSSSSDPYWIYDVFLSFKGEDTRKTFVSHLHAALSNAGVNTFIDKNLEKGTKLGAELVRAIQGSRISIVIFSTNYASSRWCLKELVEIMDCRTTYGQVVVPVFYDVDPSDVRHQTGAFGEGMKALTLAIGSRWMSALKEAADLVGWDARNWRQAGNHQVDPVWKASCQKCLKIEISRI
ncbi:Disease resistance protein TAO1 [Spatholobus suberectus]|nr:Disease resistance protein TAO1 [Spatholobus suberectus]